MQKQIAYCKVTAFAVIFFPLMIACGKNVGPIDPPLVDTTTHVPPIEPRDSMAIYLDSLIAYKKSAHQLHGGYFRLWADSAYATRNANSFRMLPDSLDFTFVFGALPPIGSAFSDSLKRAYAPHLHARGTRLMKTTSLGDFTRKGFAHDSTGYEAFASYVMDSLVNYYNLDGVDIDFETSSPTAQQIADLQGIVHALSRYVGPQSGTGKWFFFDTNQNHKNYFAAIYPAINYLLLQAYGRGTAGLQSAYNTFSTGGLPSGKFMVGFSFHEENANAGNRWNDVSYPDNDNDRCYQYARWSPTQGQKGGCFSYAIDRDFPGAYTDNLVPADYHVTKKIIAIQNPPR